ncbi:MAG TPA: type I-E CRISPR-associated protein Cse2/CasB [Candidatus Acidoferrum sp.]|jgi:CRISPR type I-E-associated protein CasB/Cse2|nr:type I-E CRISPR-associated protein Cse2/CasB [Candidatus Acidoferrum sp.]
MTRDEERKLADAARFWWQQLRPDLSRNHKGDPGALARLRRGGLQEAALEPATADLYRRIKPFLRDAQLDAFETAALIAAVLAHVRDHDPRQSVARAAGAQGHNDARVSPLRFRKILATRGKPDCLIAFRRLIALLSQTANAGDLAASLAEWNQDGAGDRRRTRWAFDYYDAGALAPRESQDAA